MCLLSFRQINTKQTNKLNSKNVEMLRIKKIDVGGLTGATFLNIKISEVKDKIPDVSGLRTSTLLNTRISEVENKIPDVSKLVNKADYDAKTTDIEGKYLTTADYNKLTSNIPAA